jgi:excisionase family DNA binding protein
MALKSKTDTKSGQKSRVLLTVKEVAALDQCSEKTVRRAIDAGLLAVIRIGPGGRLLRIDPAAHAVYRAIAGQ